jgi:hypothetical protein
MPVRVGGWRFKKDVVRLYPTTKFVNCQNGSLLAKSVRQFGDLGAVQLGLVQDVVLLKDGAGGSIGEETAVLHHQTARHIVGYQAHVVGDEEDGTAVSH